MATIFTKIINRDLPSYIVFENDYLISFLDINPIQYGHTLVVPKKEIDYFFDISDDLLKKIIIDSKVIAGAIKKATNCKRVAVNIYGFDISHAHIHLIPSNSNSDLDNKQPIKLSNEEFQKIAEEIKNYL